MGAGIAGLTAAALLARDGASVQVIERHTLAGGCASFFMRGGYRFDVGATLVSGFGARGIHTKLFEQLDITLAAAAVEPAMDVHIGSTTVRRFGDARWRAERLRVFGAAAEPFWCAQERIAERAWEFSSRFPALPADIGGTLALIRAFRPRQLSLVAAMNKTVRSILPANSSTLLRAFVDAQLLITAQADAASTDLSYGATALDIAREGTYHLRDGVGAIAVALARAIRRSGGAIAYGTDVDAVHIERGRACGVRLTGGRIVRAQHVVAAVPPSVLGRLLGTHGRGLQARVAALPQRWGAFMAYVGLPPGLVPEGCSLHHQIVLDPVAPPGEGNTAFLSFSAPQEAGRARRGGRALTVSTHTDVARWERAYADGTYERCKIEYGARLRAALERVVPGAWDRAELIEFATPHTFAAYTGRDRGLVGGFPQSPAAANLRALSHRSGIAGLTLCGDGIFPGQSTVGASLSGYAAAAAARRRLG